MEAATQRLRRFIHDRDSEIETLVKTCERLAKERNETIVQLENTKKYIGSIVTTADLRERSTKEFRMVKEMTETLINKEIEIEDLKKEGKERSTEIYNLVKKNACQEEAIQKYKQDFNLVTTLMKHLADQISINDIRGTIVEFLDRVSKANDAKYWFDKVVELIASHNVTTRNLGQVLDRHLSDSE